MRLLSITLLVLLAFVSCEESDVTNDSGPQNRWLVDTTQISGTISDLFGLIVDPVYVSKNQVDFLNQNDPVLVYKDGSTAYIFPIASLYNEVVNVTIKNKPIAITYCPKTGSCLAWPRILRDDTLLLKPSGMLFKDNLMPMDVNTSDIWVQMLSTCVNGDAMGSYNDITETGILIETSWETAYESFPEAPVLDNNQYSIRKSTNTKAFVGDYLGIFKGNSINEFSQVSIISNTSFSDTITIIEHESNIIVGSNIYHFMVPFSNNDGREFTSVTNQFPIVMKDEFDNYWDWTGYAVIGPDKGKQLERVTFYNAKLWAWESFFEQVSFINSRP